MAQNRKLRAELHQSWPTREFAGTDFDFGGLPAPDHSQRLTKCFATFFPRRTYSPTLSYVTPKDTPGQPSPKCAGVGIHCWPLAPIVSVAVAVAGGEEPAAVTVIVAVPETDGALKVVEKRPVESVVRLTAGNDTPAAETMI